MSTTVDNITLALISLQEDIQTYLDDNKWKNQFNLALAGDDILRGKELVLKVTDRRRQIALPLITIETGMVRNLITELGDGSGEDVVTVTILVRAIDGNQLRTITNLLRRRLNDRQFTIYDYRSINRDNLGTAELMDAVSNDVSDWNADNLAERYVSLINVTLKVTAQEFI